MLQFDAATTQVLEQAYQGSDVAYRRRCNFDALNPRPGDTLLDIGCGNGMQTIELARAVGPQGRVIGIDPSDDMRAVAQARCADLPWVDLRKGAADSLPVEDGAVDGAISLQVFEYIADIPAALASVRRALRPGGRLVIGDIHFDTFIWFSEDRDRMARMMASWNEHVADKRAPEHLPHDMAQAGFEVDTVRAVPFCDTVLRPDGLARAMLILMETYAVQNGHFSADEARAWTEEQEALAAAGRFFFSLNHYVIAARVI